MAFYSRPFKDSMDGLLSNFMGCSVFKILTETLRGYNNIMFFCINWRKNLAVFGKKHKFAVKLAVFCPLLSETSQFSDTVVAGMQRSMRSCKRL